MTEDADALAFVKQLGYAQAPVVYIIGPFEDDDAHGEQHWSGFDADKIKAIVK